VSRPKNDKKKRGSKKNGKRLTLAVFFLAMIRLDP
jgi:hypothetical protein